MAAIDRLIHLDDPDAWRAALHGVPHGFAHTWESCRAMHLTTGLATFLYVHQQDSTRVVCALSERNFEGLTDVVTPSGICGFTGNGTILDFPERWHAFARRQGYICGYIALNPLFENADHFGRPHVLNTLYNLDLSLGAAELLRLADRSRRRLVRDWQLSGNVYITDRTRLTEFFVAYYGDFLRRIGAGPSCAYAENTLRAICAAPQVTMVGAAIDGNIEAVYVFAHTRWTGDCLFNISTEAGKQFTTALLWWGVEHLAGRGVPNLNLGAGVRPNDNIAAAKQKFRPRSFNLHCLKEVYCEEAYLDLCRHAGADPRDCSGFFPPYRPPSSGHQHSISNR